MTTPMEFLWRKAIRKGLTAAVTALLAIWGANLAQAGITVNEQVLIAFLSGVVGTLRNWLKVTHGWPWL